MQAVYFYARVMGTRRAQTVLRTLGKTAFGKYCSGGKVD